MVCFSCDQILVPWESALGKLHSLVVNLEEDAGLCLFCKEAPCHIQLCCSGRIWLCWKHHRVGSGCSWCCWEGGGGFLSATVLISFLLPLLQKQSCRLRSWNKNAYFLIRNWMPQGILLVWNFTLNIKVKLCFLNTRIALLPTALWCVSTATEPQLQPFKLHSKYNRAS